MSLLKRIERGQPAGQGGGNQQPPLRPDSSGADEQPYDPFNGHVAIYAKVRARLDAAFERQDPHARRTVEDLLNTILQEDNIAFSEAEHKRLSEAIVAEIVGFGPLEALLADDDVVEIMVNGPKHIYVEHRGRLSLSAIQFQNDAHLVEILDRMLGGSGQGLDPKSRIVNFRLFDGTVVNAVLPPIARYGPTITIRKFRNNRRFTIEDLIRFGTVTAEIAEFLRACVIARLNIVVSGGGGSGKTTLLNALANFIPSDERIVILENTPELELRQDHVISLMAYTFGSDATGDVTLSDLVKNVMRMRADRMVIGEVQAGEMLDILQAINTGNDGTLMTIHSNSTRDTLARFETMCLMSGVDLPLRAIREQIASAINLIVQIERLRDGTRKIVKITELQGMEGDIIVLSDIFEFEQTAVEAGKVIGRIRPTGLRPSFMDKLEQAGIRLPPSVFGIGASRPQMDVPPTQAESTSVEETPATENVNFTMFHPKDANAEKWYTTLVYAHLESVLDTVHKDASKFSDEMADDVRELHGQKPAKLARGTTLQFIPEAEGIEFKPSSLTLTWDEDVERASFRFRASSQLIGQPSFGEMGIYVGPLQVANIRFSIFIKDPDSDGDAQSLTEPVAARSEMYQNVFVSYSHHDTAIVEACSQAFRAIGYDVLVDYEKLRSGEDWNEALKKLIDQADIFQLFWSHSAAESDYVKQEWQYALGRIQGASGTEAQGFGFIRPVYWERPMPDVPAEMAHLHFKYLPSLAPTSG